MKFSLPREILLQALNRISSLSDRKMTGKSSGGLKMICLPQKLTILATDGEIYMVQNLPDSEVKEEGEAIVATKVLHDIVKFAEPGAKLELELLEKFLHVSYGEADFKLNLLIDGSFPEVPTLANRHSVSIESSLLSRIFKQVSFAASKDKLCRPFLCGVNLNFVGNQLIALATDGFRLARKKVEIEPLDSPKGVAIPGVIIPSKAVTEMLKLLDEKDLPVTVGFDQQQVSLDLPGVKLFARLVDAKFPNCDAIFPSEESRPNVLVISDVAQLITVVERISAVSLEKREPLKISLADDNSMIISTLDRATGSAEQRLAVEYNGTSTTLGLNSRYLLEILDNLLSNKALIRPGKDNEPVLIKDKLDQNLEYLIMPMQI